MERYLALCAEAGATPVIVLTKVDLVDDVGTYVRRARKTRAGVPVEVVNALDPESLTGVRSWIDGTSAVALVGSSGVGKSTMLNTLAGQSFASTGEIREDGKKGRHTTSHRELHILPSGGLIVDVPGMREPRVAEISSSISAGLPTVDMKPNPVAQRPDHSTVITQTDSAARCSRKGQNISNAASPSISMPGNRAVYNFWRLP